MRTALPHQRAGVGTGFLLVVVGSAFSLGCPGQLPCDVNPDYACESSADAAAPATAGAISTDSPIAGCARWPTLGTMDKFFVSRCGIAASCHGSGTAYTDMAGAFAWYRLLQARTNISCKGAPLIDTTNWRTSMLWLKTQNPVACPPAIGGFGGVTMPPQMNYDPKTPVLSAEETRCLEGFLRTVTGR